MKKLKKLIIYCCVCTLLFAMPVKAAELEESKIIAIDASIPTEYTGKTLDEVLGLMPQRATSMPTETWDWANGNYVGYFEVALQYCYTRYNFTGYSELYAYTQASRNKGSAAGDTYTVYILTGNGIGTIQTSIQINDTNVHHLYVYNLDPGTKYAFAISKANDNTVLSGSIDVIRPD